MHPTGTKEEAEKIASTLQIRQARKHIVRKLLKYYFTYHHPNLYPRSNSDEVLSKRMSEKKTESNPCGTLVTIHKKSSRR